MTSDVLPDHVHTTLRAILDLPRTCPVAVLLRHAERGPILQGEVGMEVLLTDAGFREAQELGRQIGQRIVGIDSSPVERCMQTSRAMLEGASGSVAISQSSLLGDPGVFVVDGEKAFENWVRFGNDGVMKRICTQDEPLPGMADPQKAAARLLDHISATIHGKAGVHLFVTHDVILAGFVGRLLGVNPEQDAFPRYLEGAVTWQVGDEVQIRYRDSLVLRPSR
ncbi:histidine phosphatase family protein [bacterium]|nr:histidine phosphatase family protein [bacterium]